MQKQSKRTLEYAPYPPGVDPHGWITLRWESNLDIIDWFPYRCCECLNTEHRRIALRLGRNEARVKVPICVTCLASIKARAHRRLVAGMAIGAFAIFVLWGLCLRSSPLDLQVQAIAFLTLCVVAVLIAVEHSFGGPVQMWPTTRGIKEVSIRFRNRQFYEYLRECPELSRLRPQGRA